MLDDAAPLFVQIAELVAADIASGVLGEGDRAPSTNELAAFHRVNPATAGKGVNLLVDRGLLIKRRGLGMFVAPGARERLLEERRGRFVDDFVTPMLIEAGRIGLDRAEVLQLVQRAPVPHARSHS